MNWPIEITPELKEAIERHRAFHKRYGPEGEIDCTANVKGGDMDGVPLIWIHSGICRQVANIIDELTR
jgi:hypothetical protein